MCVCRLDRYPEDVRLKVLGDLGVVLETGVIRVARLAARPNSFSTVSPCKYWS